jgi:hypothetical protein
MTSALPVAITAWLDSSESLYGRTPSHDDKHTALVCQQYFGYLADVRGHHFSAVLLSLPNLQNNVLF